MGMKMFLNMNLYLILIKIKIAEKKLTVLETIKFSKYKTQPMGNVKLEKFVLFQYFYYFLFFYFLWDLLPFQIGK